jgi:hypothetical protein
VLAIFLLGNFRKSIPDVGFVVCGNSLESTDGHGLFFNAASTAGWLARAVTGSTQNPWENIGLPIDHISIRIALLSDKSDVFGNWSVSGAGPLTINYFMKVIRVGYIGRLHCKFVSDIPD